MAIFIEERKSVSSENLGWGRPGGQAMEEALAVLQGAREGGAGLQPEAKGLMSMGAELGSVSLPSIRETDSELGKCSMHTDQRELNHKICMVGAGEPPPTGLTTLTLSYIPGVRKKAQAFCQYCRTPKCHSWPWPSASSPDILVAPCTLVTLNCLWFPRLLKRFQALVHLTENHHCLTSFWRRCKT